MYPADSVLLIISNWFDLFFFSKQEVFLMCFLPIFLCQGGQTPMHVATYYGNVTLVLILLQHGGSPDITNVVCSLFFTAMKSKTVHFIRVFFLS